MNIKVIKPQSDEQQKRQLQAVRDAVKAECSDIKRRINGLLGNLKPIEEKLANIDRLLRAIE